MMTDCNNPEHGQFNFIDRISDLPDFIIHSILSYLHTKDAYRTSVLSKRWNQIFDTNPILDFYLHKFPTEMIPRYLEYIDNRMQKFSKENLRIKTFKFALRGTDLLLPCKVDEWLEIVVRNQVAELLLEGPANYKLPCLLFCAKSLTYLSIANVEIPYYEAMDLVSLETLVLDNVVVEERLLFHILSSCLLLKDLGLLRCSGFKNIVIPRDSKLEDFYIDGKELKDGRVILETSSLRSLKLDIHKETPWPIISNPGLLRNLRHLHICSISITDEDLAKLIPELASLEKLEFWCCKMLESIKISHTQLKHVCLGMCDSLLNVVIDAPNLNKFEFSDMMEMDPSLSITIRSQANCNIDIDAYARYFTTVGVFILKKLLKGLNSCDVLNISVFGVYDSSESDSDGDGDAELGPPCDIGELKLNLTDCQLSSSSLLAFLNSLFWTCHPRIISLRVDLGQYKLKVEPLVNNLVDMVKCLDHPLKRIEVGETKIHSYFDIPSKLEVQLRLLW